MKSQGWTLLELILVIVLITLLGSLIFRMFFQTSVFQEYVFVHQLEAGFSKQLGLKLYGDTSADIRVQANRIQFLPRVKDASPWEVDGAQLLTPRSIDKLELLADSKDQDVVFETQNYEIWVDTKTHYAYVKSKHE